MFRPCKSYLLWYNRWVQNWIAKNNTHLLSRSFCGSETMCCIPGASASQPLTRLHWGCQPVCGSPEGSTKERSTSNPSSKSSVFSRAQVPGWMLTRSRHQFLATWVSPIWKLASTKYASQECKATVMVSCNLIEEVISLHLCHLLLIQIKSPGSEDTEGERITWACESQEMGSLGLQWSLPNMVSLCFHGFVVHPSKRDLI